jgi:hypothetical protein
MDQEDMVGGECTTSASTASSINHAGRTPGVHSLTEGGVLFVAAASISLVLPLLTGPLCHSPSVASWSLVDHIKLKNTLNM